MSDGTGADDLHIRLMLTEPTISKITEAAIAEALVGFPLEPLRDMAWLARAIQPAVYCSARSRLTNGQGNAATRDELQRLADRASSLWRDIFEMSADAREAIDRFAFDRWVLGGESATWADSQAELDAYHEALKQLFGLSVLISKAAIHVGEKRQPQNWRRTAEKNWRIDFAVWLTPAFEKGFGRNAARNNRHYASGKAPQYWADFYQRIIALAFGEIVTPNLEAVLVKARQRLPKDGVFFAEGFFPE